ncbi:acyl-CoA desaturase [Mucilaginibacter boryungensis]
MFKMNSFWEKVFYFCTFLFQGSSFLNPRAYAIMHRMHHAYSDTEKDPHSPHFIKDVWGLMMKTKTIYLDYRKYKLEPEAQFIDRYPTWSFVDRFGDLWITRLFFVAFYIGFYVMFANHWYLWMLLPFHFIMGPLHGAIVNWCGHKYGYSNHDNDDHSKNSLPLDFLMLGELFQNNHHKKPNDVNFAQKWYEFDPSYPIIKIMHKLRIIRLRKA